MNPFRYRAVVEADHAIQNPTSPEKLRRVIDYLRLKDGDRVVDVGCGKGWLLRAMAAERRIDAVGLEINRFFAADARRALAETPLVGKVEIVEVFSYDCIHCAAFAPDAAKLSKELPAGVEFKLMPAPFNSAWLPFARGYYAAKQLGVVDRTHQKLFVAKFGEHYPINSMDEIADFYAREGVNRADFMRIATSQATTDKMKRDYNLARQWQVDGTPSLVIDGKYRVLAVSSQAKMVAVALWLARRELAGK